MSRHWKPNKATVELAPSRIRRVPPPHQQTILRRTDEQETWIGAMGVILISAALAAVVVGIGVVTIIRATAKQDRTFAQCYNAGGSDCVLDGHTLRIARQSVAIAGLVAPRIQGSACPAERASGIAAAVALSQIMQSGKVSFGKPSRTWQGAEVQSVTVDGVDVAARMIGAGHGRRDDGAPQNWCAG